MRTTIRLNDPLFRQVKRKAIEEHKTFTAIVEDLLSAWVKGSPSNARKKNRIKLPVDRRGGGVLPGVDLSNNASLFDRLDGLE